MRPLTDQLSATEAAKIIETLKTEKIITEDEANLMRAALNPMAVPLPLQMKDALAAGTLRSMLLTIAKRKNTADTEASDT